MFGLNSFFSAGLVAAAVIGVGTFGSRTASAYHPNAGGYQAPTPAYTLPYVPSGYAPSYNTTPSYSSGSQCAPVTPPAPAYCPPAAPAPAPVYYPQRPIGYCPPPAPPVVVYRPVPVYPAPVYRSYDRRPHRDRIQVNVRFGNRW